MAGKAGKSSLDETILGQPGRMSMPRELCNVFPAVGTALRRDLLARQCHLSRIVQECIFLPSSSGAGLLNDMLQTLNRVWGVSFCGESSASPLLLLGSGVIPTGLDKSVAGANRAG